MQAAPDRKLGRAAHRNHQRPQSLSFVEQTRCADYLARPQTPGVFYCTDRQRVSGRGNGNLLKDVLRRTPRDALLERPYIESEPVPRDPENNEMV